MFCPELMFLLLSKPDYLIKLLSVGFCLSKVIIFPFAINMHLWEICKRPWKYHLSPQNSVHYFHQPLVDIGYNYSRGICLGLVYISHIPSPGINRNSAFKVQLSLLNHLFIKSAAYSCMNSKNSCYFIICNYNSGYRGLYVLIGYTSAHL